MIWNAVITASAVMPATTLLTHLARAPLDSQIVLTNNTSKH
jgi:hypothetical protein